MTRTRRIVQFFTALAGIALAPSWAAAQSVCSNIAYGKILTEAQWNYCFQQKQDSLGYAALNKGGDTMLGKLVTAPSSNAQAGLALAIGLAPTSPNDGDIWTTSSGLFVRIGGATIGPLGQGAPTSASANLVYAGPTTGVPAAPSFRSLVADDLPVATGSAFGAVKPDGTTITISGGVISSAGASATSIQSGVTNFLSATSGNCAYNNAGKVGDKNCLTQVKTQKFQTAGSFTYTPTAGLVYAQVECVGGGGAGGGANGSGTATAGGGGGGSGAYSRVTLTAAAIGASKVVTIGSGGGGSTGNGGAGGDTSVTTLCVAKGGSGGQQAVNSGGNGGAGGLASGSTGDVTVDGNGGGAGTGSGGTATLGTGGSGAGSFFGGGASSQTLSGAGQTAKGCGGGGSGATISGSASYAGGNGYQGCIVITEFINQ